MTTPTDPDLAKYYGTAFYQKENRHSMSSAENIVPLIMELLSPSSVIDIGCGQGEWLNVFARTGADVYGVDGPHITDAQLLIPKSKFTHHDLTQPYQSQQTYSIALSLEVGEHLPDVVCTEYVASLTRLASAVVFSAALPGQGGVNHINEQWPWYWQALFKQFGYVRLDPFRHRLWHNPHVAFYYQQNLFLFVDPSKHQTLVDKIGIEDKYSELTLIKTTILQDMTAASTLQRGLSKVKKMLKLK